MKRANKIAIFYILFFLFFVNTCLACGPEFDEAYLVRGSKEQFLSIPEGHFLYELERIVEYEKKSTKEIDLYKHTADTDILDLKKALRETKLPEGKRQKAIASYTEARSQLLYYLKTYPVEKTWVWYGGSFRHHERGISRIPFRFASDFKFAQEIPQEFTLYIKGAVAYHNNNFNAAIRKWKELLGLPQEKRHYRSTWAAFMIGKAYLSMRKSKEAIEYFKMTRDYASGGFKDSLDLVYESYGWQALAEYESKNYPESIKHYLKQLDVNSLNWLCSKIFALDDKVFSEIVKDDLSRKVLIGWAVSRQPWTYWYRTIDDDPQQNIYVKLLRAIRKIDKKKNIENADRIAWIFYNHGDFSGAKEWLKVVNKESPLAEWIESKLLLREGKIDEAIKKLQGLIHLFEKNQEWGMFYKTAKADIARSISTEIGLLRLRRQDYIVAFDTLIKGGAYWEDIAYVAEKVLTTQELENYLKQHHSGLDKKLEWYYPSNLEIPTIYNALRYLLARRFARNDNWEKAIEYIPISFKREWEERTPSKEGYTIHEQRYEIFNPKEELIALYENLKRAKNVKLQKQERARSYYKAALLMRKYGMELIGTELDPDWFVFNGQFAYDDTIEQRFGIMNKDRQKYYRGWYDEIIEETRKKRQEIEKRRDFFVGSKDEEDRALNSLPDPARRFHYRFKAANLMWQCAQLLPNNDELKAKALCTGGTYLKIRDPQAADKFYKELVNTCRKTELGQLADKLRWFPKIQEGN
jgi:hypothetical protein